MALTAQRADAPTRFVIGQAVRLLKVEDNCNVAGHRVATFEFAGEHFTTPATNLIAQDHWDEIYTAIAAEINRLTAIKKNRP